MYRSSCRFAERITKKEGTLLYAGRGKCGRSSTEVLRRKGIIFVVTKIEKNIKNGRIALAVFVLFGEPKI